MKRRDSCSNGSNCANRDNMELQDSEDDYARSFVADLRRDDARIRHLFDLRLLPAMMTITLMFSIKCIVFSQAFLLGIGKNLDLNASQYSWLYAIPHIPQIALQFPIAWALGARFPFDDKFSSPLLVFSGFVLTLLPEVGFRGLVIGGLLLGLLEASFLPSLVSMTHIHWSREEQPLRISCWFCMSGVANIVSLSLASVTSVRLENKGFY